MPDLTTKDVLIVGVDESAHGDAALRYALEEAARRGAVLRAVIACRPPEMSAYTYEILQVPNAEQVRVAAAAAVHRRVEEIRSSVPAEVEVEVVAETGSPVSVLVDAARDADLLVVGHRGRGALLSALLGSVGLGVVLNAPCLVTVVPAPVLVDEPDGAGRPVHGALPLPLPVGPVA
jgi:nucleotide-binding universal stress UspA family protein